MPLSTFEKFLPWTGAVAGLAWIGQDAVGTLTASNTPGGMTAEDFDGKFGPNVAHLGLLVIMGIALLFFATSVRNLLRSGEAREATYSSVAYGGWLLVVSGLAQMTVWANGLMSAADDGKSEALDGLSYISFFGWAGMTIGLATAFIAFGLGGLANAVLPKWFAILTIVMGALCALGAAHIPPGGLVSYVALPFWLIGTSFVIAKRQKGATV